MYDSSKASSSKVERIVAPDIIKHVYPETSQDWQGQSLQSGSLKAVGVPQKVLLLLCLTARLEDGPGGPGLIDAGVCPAEASHTTL